MAVSPLVPESPSVTTSSSTAPVKSKQIAAVNTRHGQQTSRLPASFQDPDRELAEQLNDDVRNKYVKGTAPARYFSVISEAEWGG